MYNSNAPPTLIRIKIQSAVEEIVFLSVSEMDFSPMYLATAWLNCNVKIELKNKPKMVSKSIMP